MVTLETAPSVEGAPGKREPGRAGRNLPIAILIGLLLGALILVPLYSPYPWAFMFVIAAAMAVGTYEVVKALQGLGAQPPLLPLLAGGGTMVVLAYQQGAELLFVALVLTVLACIVWRLADPAEGYLRDAAAATFTAVYVPFLISFAALMLVPHDGNRWVTVFIATVVCSDVGGYAVGSLIGRHPMAPSVSPKKSWEGFVGSVVFCALGGAIMFDQILHASQVHGVIFGLAVVVTATLGDLGESMVKRDIGVKDMGNLLPGHGGIMDRLDSLLIAAPIAWLLLTWMVDPGSNS
jgi:phosphatidate cytidylyltransferase